MRRLRGNAGMPARERKRRSTASNDVSGRYVDGEGNVYEGRFDGSLNGPGRKVEADGTTYEGEFKDWLYHGRGALGDANGDRYEGEFANGLYHGQGTLSFAAAKPDGRTKDSGLWRWGKRVDEAAQLKERLDLEAALYSQRKLLDAALGKLAPRDPSKINLYLLALAGDGSQEVFHRDARFVQDMFDRQYGTAGRSLALINSRTTMASTPLATRTSLREALAALALLVIGFVLSIIIAIKTKAMHLLWIYPLASGLLFAYSKSLKSTPLWGNMLVSLFTAFV